MKPRVVFLGGAWPAPVYQQLAAAQGLMDVVEGFVEFDIYEPPWFERNTAVAATNDALLRDLIDHLPAGCYLLVESTEASMALQALSIAEDVRGLIAIGFVPTIATLKAAESPWADVLERNWHQYPLNLSKTAANVMPGAEDASRIQIVNMTLDRLNLRYIEDLFATYHARNFLAEPPEIKCPTLYLEPEGVLGGGGGARGLFMSLVPHARLEKLQEGWPSRMTDRDAGREVGRKVLTFIQEVEEMQSRGP
jgi:hypothetical protein